MKAAAAESAEQSTAEEEAVLSTEPQPGPSTAAEPGPSTSMTETAELPVPTKRQKTRVTDEQKCAATMQKYFQGKIDRVPQHDADDTVCHMLADELRKVKSASIKRNLKRSVLDSVFAAQEQEEGETVYTVVYAEEAPDTGAVAQATAEYTN